MSVITTAPPTMSIQNLSRLKIPHLWWWPLAVIVIWAVLILFPGVVAWQDPYRLNISSILNPPSAAHWFGTDEVGRDIFSRCLWGLRYSLGTAVLISLSTALIGTIIGGLAGLAGGWIDSLIMRVTDGFLAFPFLILAISISAAAGPGLKTVAVTLIVIWWPSHARVVRGMVLSLREMTFVENARAISTGTLAILYRHMLPHMLPVVGARVTMEVGYVVIALTGLGFLGLGAQSPTPELGSMIAEAHAYLLIAWWSNTLPGVLIVLAVLSAMTIGDWLETLSLGSATR